MKKLRQKRSPEPAGCGAAVSREPDAEGSFGTAHFQGSAAGVHEVRYEKHRDEAEVC